MEGHYRITRDGRVPIDIHADGELVFAEDLHDRGAWKWQQGEEEDKPGSERPEHFHALSHMETNGHDVDLAGTDAIEGTSCEVVAVTLADGFLQ